MFWADQIGLRALRDTMLEFQRPVVTRSGRRRHCSTVWPTTARPSRGNDEMSANDLAYTPATELAALIRSKKLSPVELTRVTLDRIERLNPTLNAFCTVTADTAMAAARAAEQAVMAGTPLGPIHGVPFSIKDLAFT
jgi:hypothetical protein